MRKSIQREEYLLFTELLKQARVNSGLTQREVAQRMMVAHSFVNKVEHSDIRMDIVQIRDYLQAVGVPFTQFMNDYDSALKSQ